MAENGWSEITKGRRAEAGNLQNILWRKACYYKPLLKLMRMDFAPGIVAVARKA